jgi:soluble lytic murein transglycosylase-like protein
MSTAPILRSSALQKMLALTPARPPQPAGSSFAATLARARTKPNSTTPVTRPMTVTPISVPTSAIAFKDEIAAAARKYGLDPALLAAVVKQESNFNPKAQSAAGAKGLTQLMDATAGRLGVKDSFDPVENLDAGARFLSGLLTEFHGDERLALAAYNAGPGAVQKYGGIPPYQETQRYVPKVLGYAAQFRRISAFG